MAFNSAELINKSANCQDYGLKMLSSGPKAPNYGDFKNEGIISFKSPTITFLISNVTYLQMLHSIKELCFRLQIPTYTRWELDYSTT